MSKLDIREAAGFLVKPCIRFKRLLVPKRLILRKTNHEDIDLEDAEQA